MPANAKPAPITLGDKLMTNSPTAHIPWLGRVILTLANIALLTGVTTVPLWLLKTKPEMSLGIVFALLVLLVTWLVVWRRLHFASPLHSTSISKGHTLLANDRNGFMSHLRLDAKTAIIDGSNIYHFGHDNDVGTDIIRLLANSCAAMDTAWSVSLTPISFTHWPATMFCQSIKTTHSNCWKK